MHIVQILNKEHQITSKKDTAMSRQLKFLMLASELSSRGKKLREQGYLERKSESSKSKRFL